MSRMFGEATISEATKGLVARLVDSLGYNDATELRYVLVNADQNVLTALGLGIGRELSMPHRRGKR